MSAWQLYSLKAIVEARAWAAGGGVAVHLSGNWVPPGRKTATPCAHILAADLPALKAVAAQLGMQERWIQHPSNDHRRHLDVWGARLERAKALCANATPIERPPVHQSREAEGGSADA